MKRIVSLLLVFILLAMSAFSAFAKGEKETLAMLEILPPAYDADNSNELATRGEFAYMTAKLLDGDIKRRPTVFADIDETNPYSGAIAYLYQIGAISGSGDGLYKADEPISLFAAAKILSVGLGYGEIAENNGGFPYGYVDVLESLGLIKGLSVSENGTLTKKDASDLIYRALTENLKSVSYMADGSEIKSYLDGGEVEPLIKSRFNLSMLYGVVTNVAEDGKSIEFQVSKSENKKDFPVNSEVSLVVDGKVSASEFENVPCIIYINDDSVVVNIVPQKNVEIKYTTIVSVNGSKTLNYPIENIDEILLLDDETEYDIAENATLKYNGAYTNGAPGINGNFAKIVIVNGEISHIESWTLKTGGLITAFDGDTIVYQNGINEARLRELSSYKKQRIIIDGNQSSLSNVKIFSTFSYRIADDSLVLVLSEKMVSDILHSVSASEMTIGDMAYSKEENVYCSIDGKNFVLNNYDGLYSQDVCAYIGWDGYVKYITNGPSSNPTAKSYAVVSGVNRDNMDEKCARIRLLVVENNIVTEKEYSITEKTLYNSIGLSLDVLESKARNLAGEGVYLFAFNSKGEVVSVENPSWIHGFGEAKTNITYFDDYNTIHLNNKPYYLDHPVLVIYEENGEFKANVSQMSDLTGKTLKGTATLYLYGKERSIEPDLVVLAGNVYGMGRYIGYGILTEINDVIGEDGELKKEVVILSGGSENTYIVSEENLKKITAPSYVTYNYSILYSVDEIVFNTSIPLSVSHENWPCGGDSAVAYGLRKGIADFATKKAIALKGTFYNVKEDGETVLKYEDGEHSFFFHPNQNFIVTYNEDLPKNKFQLADYTDVDSDDTVFFYQEGDGMRGLIIIK